MGKIPNEILTTGQKRKIQKLRTKILKWAKTGGEKFAWRKRPTVYSVLMAEFFLQRTRAPQAETQYILFLSKYPTFAKLQKARASDLAKFLIPLGLKKRVKLLKKLIYTIAKRYKGRIPTDYKELKNLPGVGDYTASAILIFALDEPAGLVDANTIRVFSRLFNIKITREDGKKSKFIKSCAEYYSSLGKPRISNWALLDYAIHTNE
jgi:A/G-specific adenine glycosylase